MPNITLETTMNQVHQRQPNQPAPLRLLWHILARGNIRHGYKRRPLRCDMIRQMRNRPICATSEIDS